MLLAVVLVLAVAAGAYLLRRDDTGTTTAAARCPSSAPSASAAATGAPKRATAVRLPEPAKVTFRLLNGSPRDGLARKVGDKLAARGFRISQTGNSPAPLGGPSEVRYGAGAEAAALLVATQVLDARVVSEANEGKGQLSLVLGTGFSRLRTPEEAGSAAAEVVAAARAAPSPAAAPQPGPTSGGCP